MPVLQALAISRLVWFADGRERPGPEQPEYLTSALVI